MGEFEEETYSTVFKALKHPVRRKLLRVLSQGSRTFTDLQSAFKVNGAVLTYHLDAMKELICKTEDGKYSLSTMGEGAIALMERVEDPPKVVSTNPSHKNGRRLSILQSATICIAVILLVSGTYLTSISSVQDFYDVPADWSLAHVFYEYAQYDHVSGWTSLPDFYDIDGNSYDIRYSLFVDPSSQLLNQLTKEHEADIYVNLRTNETAPSALCFVTLNYLEFSLVDFNYHLKKQTYQGEFQPVKNPIGLAFSTHISLPFAFSTQSALPSGQFEDQLPTLPKSIRVNIWTNTTYNGGHGLVTDEQIMTDFLNIKAAATEEFYFETHPYENQGSIITTIGIILVAAALMMHILPLLIKQT
jgi:DNA-binding transcriptional ArsR family regulator